MRTDTELLDAWRGGNARAGEELVGRLWPGVSRFFRSKVGDELGAELISQTFLACVEGRERIADGNVKAYVFGIARRRLADHFRRRARRPSEESDPLASSLADLAPGPATELDRRRRGAMLRAALARIPLDDQLALELAYFEQLSGAELAAVLDVAENTVRSRLSRARAKLREVLAVMELGGERGSEAEEHVLAALRDEQDG